MEYNLRDRAKIVHLAQQAAEDLHAQPLIDFFEAKFQGKLCKCPAPKGKLDPPTKKIKKVE